jgi:hypothetical protein
LIWAKFHRASIGNQRFVSAGHAVSALLSPAREEAASGRLPPSPPSFAPEFRIAISNSLPELPSNLLVFIGFPPTCGQKRVTHLFSSTHWEHFSCPFVFNKSLGGIFIFNILFPLPF